MSRRYSLIIVIALLCLSGCSPEDSRETKEPALESQTSETEWPLHGLDYGETRYSSLTDIDQTTVTDLGVAWSYELGSKRGVETTPIVADGTMYVTAPWSVVHAIDATTGQGIWKYDPEVPRQWGRWACCDVVNRGVAIWGDRLFVGTLDGRLVAVDRSSGKKIWEVRTTPTDKPYTITGAPRVAGDKVIIGNGGAEYGVRGYVTAYDVKSGVEAWRFYTVPGDPSKPLEHPDLEIALPTWTGEWWDVGGGGTAWDSMAFDPELNLIYVGVGNGSPWARYERSPGGGDNLFLSSVIAVDVETGRLRWHYQTTPSDNWDYTATQHILLTDLTINGEHRKVLLQAPKNGFLYVLDRVNGELISATPYVHMNWATHVDIESGRPVETEDGNYEAAAKKVMPGPPGGHNWQPMSFSQKTQLLYVPAHDTGIWYSYDDQFEYDPTVTNLGLKFTPEVAAQALADPVEHRGYLIAWDPIEAKPRWKLKFDGHWNGGLLSTAGGLVFQGTPDGNFTAYRDSDGEVLWRTSSTPGFFAPPVTYKIKGEQYIAIAAGVGGGGGMPRRILPGAMINEYENEGRIIAFKLGAKSPMPLSKKKPDRTIPDLPQLSASDDDLEKGRVLFGKYCQSCHGGGMLHPDLRYLTQAKHAILKEIVLGGAFLGLGMPRFDDVLNEADVDAIQFYLFSQTMLLRASQNEQDDSSD